jgi:hypothetical protein
MINLLKIIFAQNTMPYNEPPLNKIIYRVFSIAATQPKEKKKSNLFRYLHVGMAIFDTTHEPNTKLAS